MWARVEKFHAGHSRHARRIRKGSGKPFKGNPEKRVLWDPCHLTLVSLGFYALPKGRRGHQNIKARDIM